MSDDRTSFDRFVEEQERDPEFKALLDAERERLRRELDDDDSFGTVVS
jgi:hypothetical protein